MIIKNASFLTSLASYDAKTGEELPEIAMAGKSNVGKSSLINSLARNSKLAKISSEPGKTRLVNYYLFNHSFYLVDLPGYGFAKAPKQEQDKWARMIEDYLTHSSQLKHVFHLVDIRHEPTADDAMMTEYLRHYKIPFSVIATKADKLSKAQRNRMIPAICRKLVVQPWEVLVYSSEDLTGREELLTKMDKILIPETTGSEE